MKQILFIYRDSVVTELTKSILKSHNVESYGINEVTEDFSYLVNDLKPELVLIDEQLLDASKEIIEQSVQNCTFSESKWVLLTEDENRPNPFHLSYILPLKAKSIYEDLKDLVDSNLVKN